MGTNGYSYEELTTPLVSKFRKRMQRQLGKVGKVFIEALKANKVSLYEIVPDHLVRIKAGTEIVRLGGGDPPRKLEAKHEHEGTIFHDLTERLEKAIEASEDAIRRSGKRSSRVKKKG